MDTTVAESGRREPRAQFILLGAVGGLAWAASLRAFMVEIAGAESQFAWLETFVGILLPGITAGALLGWAEIRRRAGRPLRVLILAPLLFPLVTLSLPGQLSTLLTTGLGSGALATPLLGIAGGYALAGSRRWVRIVCGILTVSLVPIAVLAIVVLEIPLTARSTWTLLLLFSLLAVQAWACAIPLRPVPRETTTPAGAANSSARAHWRR
ncbi:hypothetical protein ACLRGF_06940 [Mycetocola zhadangensis]|uniref:hypothetical protein n=1 Tax=Mycetocola zhadangensis TaxID=1164595 RepID=UPI003A4E0A6D